MILKVITPNKTVISEDIDELVVNTNAGEITILPQHMSIVSSLRPGEMVIKAAGKTRHFAVAGGFLEVEHDEITVLADYAIASDDIQVDKALEAKKRAEEVLKKTGEGISERDFALAEAELRKAVMQINVSNKRKKLNTTPPRG